MVFLATSSNALKLVCFATNMRSSEKLRKLKTRARSLRSVQACPGPPNSVPYSQPQSPLVPNGHLHQIEDHAPAAASSSWCVYCLISADLGKTYVGVTSNVHRRIRQHNGEISGGAKAARAGRPWKIICTVRGFTTYSEACQFEWSWKNISKRTSAKIRSDGNIVVRKASLIKDSPVVEKRQAALERVKSSKDWQCLDIQWYLSHENS